MIDIETLRKRVIMRAEHRGIKEMDIILGEYARANVANMSTDELVEFEALMDMNDQAIFAMILGREAMEPAFKRLLHSIRSARGIS